MEAGEGMKRLLPVFLARDEWVEVMSALEGAAQDLRNSGVPTGTLPEEVEEQARRLMGLKEMVLHQISRRLRRVRPGGWRTPLFLERQSHENACALCGRQLWNPQDSEVHDRVVLLDVEHSGHASADALGSWCSLDRLVRDLKERLRARMERVRHRKREESAEEAEV